MIYRRTWQGGGYMGLPACVARPGDLLVVEFQVISGSAATNYDTATGLGPHVVYEPRYEAGATRDDHPVGWTGQRDGTQSPTKGHRFTVDSPFVVPVDGTLGVDGGPSGPVYGVVYSVYRARQHAVAPPSINLFGALTAPKPLPHGTYALQAGADVRVRLENGATVQEIDLPPGLLVPIGALHTRVDGAPATIEQVGGRDTQITAYLLL
ncbi:hypothetical protein [Chondromyces apiculatus]|uniref:Uncharacterized protein n=1 Tax=Chondromyces apiculatus DSM 436 TaxID=1192034 RepID=A0A017TCS0_9BACT|nr:hypothetical protein [Chondromyces apiculatus]EYF07058.1 Hypothetical protein CAP_1317 [Chondromyces apiculatus DSM 436]